MESSFFENHGVSIKKGFSKLWLKRKMSIRKILEKNVTNVESKASKADFLSFFETTVYTLVE